MVFSPREKKVTTEELAFIETLFRNSADEAVLGKWVTQHKPGYKQDRLLVVSNFRLITLKKSKLRPLRVSKKLPFLQLTKLMVYQEEDDGLLEAQFGTIHLIINGHEHMEGIVRCIRQSIDQLQFPVTLRPVIELSNAFWKTASEPLDEFQGFVNTYRAFCDLYGASYRESVVEHLEESLVKDGKYGYKPYLDFQQIFRNARPAANTNDAKALFGALKTCTLFDSVSIVDFSLTNDGAVLLFESLQYNFNIKGLLLSNVSLSTPAMIALKEAARAQSSCEPQEGPLIETTGIDSTTMYTTPTGLLELDLCGNTISRSMAVEFSHALKAFTNGLQALGLENCNMCFSLFTHVISAIRLPAWTSSLRELNLSGNRLYKEGSIALGDWISCSFALKRLHLATTGLDTTEFMASLKKNSVLRLEFLDLSYNRMTLPGGKDLGEIMLNTTSLTELLLKGTNITQQSLRDILCSTFRNSCEYPFSIDLSDNDLSGSKGKEVSQIISDAPMGRRERLAFNNCSMGDDTLAKIVSSIQSCSSLNTLSIAGNAVSKLSMFSNSTETEAAAVAFQGLLNTSDSNRDELENNSSNSSPPALQELCLSSSKTPFRYKIIQAVISTLQFNSHLQVLDISGNKCGDRVAEGLSLALLHNCTLKALFWDNSHTSVKGFQSFSHGLQQNFSLIMVPVPLKDTRKIIESRGPARDTLFSTFKQIYKCIERNHGLSTEMPPVYSRGNRSSFSSSRRQSISSEASWTPVLSLRGGLSESSQLSREMNEWKDFIPTSDLQ